MSESTAQLGASWTKADVNREIR
ncbi:MAG: hypothetical protein QOI44_880, partial [Actinomycetota bacterium]|nr:hypothetical protein [Actinomycetota bacterium]